MPQLHADDRAGDAATRLRKTVVRTWRPRDSQGVGEATMTITAQAQRVLA